MDQAKSRSRCSNYTFTEMEVLLSLVEQYKSVVECKKTDSVSNADKEKQWENIAEKFNSITGTGRTSKQLRSKWDAWKKATKKDYATKKNELFKTGGGPYIDIKLDNFGDRVLAIMGVSATGTENNFDSDGVGAGSFVEGSSDSGEATQPTTENPQPTPDEVMFDLEFLNPEFLEIVEQKENKPVETSAQEQCSSVIEVSEWKQWSPALLKKPITPALSQKLEIKTPSRQNEKMTAVTRKRKRTPYQPVQEGVLQKKLELLDLQMHLLKKEHEERERRAEEKHLLEVEFLKKQISCKCKCNI